MEIRSPAYTAYDEHVGVVEVAGSCEGGPLILAESDGGNARPGVADVAGGAPAVGQLRPVGGLVEGGAV